MKRPTLKATLVVLALGLVVACGAAGWLLGTTAGLRFAVARALPYLPATLDPGELDGRLVGPLTTGRIEVATNGVSGSIDRITLDWRPAALLRGTVHVLELTVQGPTFTLPANGSRAPSAEDRPWPSLPIAIHIDHLLLRAGTLRRADETLIADLDLSLAGRARDQQLDIERLELDSDRGAVSGRAQLSLADETPWDIDLSWRLALDDMLLAGHTVATGDVTELAFSQGLSQPLAARLEGRVVELRGTPRWQADLALEALPESDPWPTSLHGLAATLRIAGTLADSEVTGQVEAPALWPDTLAVTARGGWSAGGAELRALELDAGGGARLVASGQWTPGDPATTVFKIDAAGLDWPPAGPEVAFSLPRLAVRGQGEAGQWAITGEALARRAGLPDIDIETALTWDGETAVIQELRAESAENAIRGRATGQLTMQEGLRYRAAVELAVRLPDYPPAALSLDIAGDAEGLEVDPVDIAVLDGHIAGAGRIAWAGEAGSDFRLSFTALDPASMAPDWPGRLSGELLLSGLPDNPDGMSIILRSLRGILRELPVEGAVDAVVGDDRFILRPSRLEIGGSTLAASGRLDANTATLDASLEAPRLHELYEAAAGSLQGSLRISGPRTAPGVVLELQAAELAWGEAAPPKLAVATRLEGSYAKGGWTGQVETLAVAAGEFAPWQLQEPAALALSADRVALDGACMDGPPGRACLDLGWARDDEWQSRATIAALDLESASAWLGADLQLAGALQGQVELAGQGREFKHLAGRIEIAAGGVSQASEEPGEWLLEWREGVLRLDGDPAGAHAELDLDLTSDDEFDGRLAVAWNETDPSLDGEIRIAFSQLGIITDFVPDLSQLKGRANATATLTGSLSAPQATGRFEWRDGSLQIPGLGIHPQEIDLVAELAENELVFTASGRSGEGEFSAAGQFDLGNDAVAGTATLAGERIIVMDLPEMRVAASPDLRFRYLPGRINIGGEVTIPFARITGLGGSGAITASPDEVIVGASAVEEEAAQDMVITSRIRVAVGPDARIATAGLRGNLEGEIISVTEPDTLPWGRGELRVVAGNFSAFGQQLEIATGRLIYTGGPLENPGLDIRAIRTIRDVTAGVLVRGTLERPDISIYSNPPMPRTEALSYLILGKGMDELQAGERRTVDQAANSLALSGGGLIARDLGNRLGFDEVSVATDNDTGGAALVVGRHLGGGLYVSYGLGLFDAVNTLRLRYQINQRLSIEAVSGDQAEADLFYTFERD